MTTECNATLAILMDTPGLKQQEIGPLLHHLVNADLAGVPNLQFRDALAYLIAQWEGEKRMTIEITRSEALCETRYLVRVPDLELCRTPELRGSLTKASSVEEILEGLLTLSKLSPWDALYSQKE